MSTSTVPYQQNPYTPGSSSSAIQCYRCGDTCKGEVVRVQSNHFHIRCFTCQVCGCDLAQSGFFFKNQEYICTHDYQQLYGTRCDSCGDFITGEVISALGRTYHPKCFVCSTCRKPFPIGDKVTFSGKDCVCQNCSHSLLSTKPIKIHGPSHCAGCKEEIKQGQSLLALEKQWHVSCFKCQTCGVILTGEYISKDGIPYCESDYHAQFGIKCETCDRYISGRVLEAGGKHYHPTCARCVRCHQMFTEGEEMYLTGSEVWHPICKQAARAEKKLKHRRTSETSISPPGSSIGSPNRVICDIYESFDTRQRRASSPGYIDSPTYSRQGMSPTIPRSPHHFYRSAAGESNIYRKPPIYKRHATKSKTSEDIAQSSKYSPAYSPDPYYHSESEYWSFQGSPKAPRARRFSSGGEEDGYDRGMHKIQSGIGRLILREEMKARSNSYADPWTPPRSSASSREALHTAGYEGSLNGSPRTHYLADSDPLISKSASLPAYRRNGLHRPPSAELFHYDSTNAVNWGMREYKVRPFCCQERPPARAGSARDVRPCVPRLFRGKLCPLPLFSSILDLAAPSQHCGAHTRVPPLLPGPKCC
ncbi:actin-binding LIM protein 3 isoform X5 [Vidua chalybeata]|uniref:actin-binding LIM protein 3 isoform X5 n=1 Tax=Vidua chalybeata TaxID=81927 RepID=UPI0023A8C268|nr:actin-binding LIM protein 3 isoform X5 [Vidua chalybeata]